MFKWILSIFQAASFPPPIKDPQEIERQYKYWRIRIFYSIYCGYALFYLTRKSFVFAMPMMITDLGLSVSDLGFLGTVLYISYGISKFANGILSDRLNPRYLMAVGLIVTGISNICFGCSSTLLFFTLFWTLNGISQGSGWPPCTKQLTYWFSKSERGFWWSLKSTAHNVGGALVPLLSSVVATLWGWRWSMYIPGFVSILGGIWLINRLRDIPQSLGLPPVEVYRKEKIPQNKTTPTDNNFKNLVFKDVLANPAIWLLALTYFFVYVVRTAINDWGALFLVQAKGYNDIVLASASITWFEVGGFFGILLSGWSSDTFCKGKRVPVMLLFSGALILAMVIFWLSNYNSTGVDSLLMAIIGFLVFGPQLLVGLAAAEFVDKSVACTANGFAGLFAYVGAAATGYPLGYVIEHWGWGGFFKTIIVCCSAMLIVLIIMYYQTVNTKGSSEVVVGETNTLLRSGN